MNRRTIKTILLTGIGIAFLILGFIPTSISVEVRAIVNPLSGYHNITIDGRMNEWNGSTLIGVNDNVKVHLTWNDTKIFVVWNGSGVDWNINNMVIAFNTTDGGATTPYWSANFSGPYLPDAAVVIKGPGNVVYNPSLNSGWDSDQDVSAWAHYAGYSGNQTTEIAIEKSYLPNYTSDKSLGVYIWLSNKTGEWAYAMLPIDAGNTNNNTSLGNFSVPYNITNTLSPGMIKIDGYFDDWTPDENMGTQDILTWNFTWNETDLFFGVSGHDFSADSNVQNIWIYIGTDLTGTYGNVSTNIVAGQTHTLPFKANWSFIYQPKVPYWNLRRTDNTTQEWLINQNYSGEVASSQYGAEMRIPKADIFLQSPLRIIMFAETDTNAWVWSISPNVNQNGSAPRTFTAYWEYSSLSESQSPNDNIYLVSELPFSVLLFIPFLFIVRGRAS